MNAEQRRALLGDAVIQRAHEIADAAPEIPKDSDLYRRLAVLLRRNRPVKKPRKGAAETAA